MRNDATKTNNAEETESWVYTYSTERATASNEGCACKLVTTIPANKYISAFPPENPNHAEWQHYLLVTNKNTIEIAPQNYVIAFKVFPKGENVPEMELTLSVKDACALLGLLAQAIEEVSPTKSKLAAY